MPNVRPATRKSLEELARLMSLPPSDLASTDLSAGFKSAGVPPRLVSPSGDNEGLTISGDEFREFRRALAQLSSESLTEHLESRDIETMLWDFCCEIFIERERYQAAKDRKPRLAEFLSTVTKAWESFECAFSIADLAMACDRMTLGKVELRQWEGVPEDWQIPGRADLTSDMNGQCVAMTSASGGDVPQAAARARAEVDRMLDALRLGVTQTIFVRISDSDLQFRRSGYELIRKVGEDGASRFSWSFEHRPTTMSIDTRRAEVIASYLAPLVSPDQDLGQGLRDRIGLATRWIGASAVKPDIDDKVVALCTAIEALLSSKSDRLKGETITIRSMLLPASMGEGFINPFPLYVLYKRRSDIVHGSKFGICGEEDYRALHFQAGLILKHMMAFLALHKDMKRFEDLISEIETEDGISNVIAWFSRYGKYGRDVVKAAEERLERVRKRATKSHQSAAGA